MEYPVGGITRSKLGVTVLLGLLGYFANGFTIRVWNGVEIVLGSAPSYLSVALFGPWWGSISAALAGGRTLADWGHPFAAILHLLEIIAVGFLIRLGFPVSAAAVAFWLSIGFPLVAFLYGSHLGQSWPYVSMIGLADLLSGLIGALVTHLLLWTHRLRPYFRKLGGGHLAATSLRNDIFTGMILVGTVPVFALRIYSGTAVREREEGTARLMLAQHAELVARCLDDAQQRALRESTSPRFGLPVSGSSRSKAEVHDIGPGSRLLFLPDSSPSAARLPALKPGEIEIPLASHELAHPPNSQTIQAPAILRIVPSKVCPVAVRHSESVGVSILGSTSGRELVSYGMAGNSDPEFGHLSSLELLTAIQRAASGSLTFQRNASDHNPFNRRAYLAGHSLAHSGVRVIFYQPAASATKEAERCQMLATFWVIVAALASGAFASWFGRRVVSPVLDLRDYLDGVNISSDSAPPIPRRPDVAAEMLPLWTGIRRLQGRTNQAIQQAQEAADAALAATRQKTEFLATISHEIRTPLNCILGMLPRVREEALSRGQQDALALVERSGQHLLSILNDVLDFSRIEQGQLVLRNDPVETVATCEEALEMLVPAATRKGLELTWIVSPDIPAVVRGDALRLKQILLNLVGNAVKFTERGSIEIDLGWESKPGPALYGAIILRVRDTGPGIGPDRIERLFQPFWQLNEPVGTPPNTGAGLGLSIIKRLLDKMGGEIRMESALGSGTLVSVSVPVEVVACGTAPPGQSVVVAGSAGRVRESLVSQLNFLGCTVEASDGVRFAPASGRWLLLDERLAHAQERENSGYLRSLTDSGWRVAIYQSRLLRPEPPLATLRLAGVRCLPAPPSVRNLRALFEETLDTMSNPLESNADCPSTMNPLRILVAEDNAENRLVIDLMLRRLGYCPSIVNDGIAAWDAIQATEFDLAMLDLRMPGIDGLSLARRIRETMPSPPRLVALTASAFDSDRKLCLDAGFSEFLSKPIQEATLLSVLSGAPRVNGPSTEEPDIWCGKNLTSFLQICGERADGMIQSILDDVSNWLTSPLDETPPAQVADRAHKLAGSAFLIGATALAQSLKAIEAAAPTGPAPLAKAVGSAAAIFDSTRKQFPELRITTALQVAAAVPADS